MKWQAFRPDALGTFLARPNRFIAVALVGGKELKLHCPNPGRLREILLPGSPVLVELPSKTHPVMIPRSTQGTLVAVLHKGIWVPLASARANQAAGIYLQARLPQWTHKPEITMGNSRFDWESRLGSETLITEVKACTLENSGTAMFPDAPSQRALKHITHMAHLDTPAQVLFTTWFPQAQEFIPHLHTDPEFAKAASTLGITMNAAVWQAGEDGYATLVNPSLPVNLKVLQDIDYTRGLALAAWESRESTVFALGDDFEIWRIRLSTPAGVRRTMPQGNFSKINDLRVYSHGELREKFIQELQRLLGGTWVQHPRWAALEVPGRPLDTGEFWDFFLPYRHRFWKEKSH